MSYISSLNLLGDDSPIPLSEESLNEELTLWANAQFTFDTEPGTATNDNFKTQLLHTLNELVNPPNENRSTMTDHLDLMHTSPPIAPIINEKKRKEIDESTEAIEDKRRRNTAASARFRMKKKLKEQALERTAKEMTDKAEALEKRVLELEKEAKWLRALVVEKDPALLEKS
ncbi:Transcription factor zip1 [Choanephora cucurbitarum]|uniref:Transcription factor zip1 n=1 Tax=Choanephora cucurbitarum TaxID=101091 RepID=A0A1C7NJH6_9FUNG|nr:Transcription factor zip1 [Choanephora cucurbitarum]